MESGSAITRTEVVLNRLYGRNWPAHCCGDNDVHNDNDSDKQHLETNRLLATATPPRRNATANAPILRLQWPTMSAFPRSGFLSLANSSK